VVIPIPETSCDIALEIARIRDKPYRQGFVKNRYVGRTFIMPGEQARRQSVRRNIVQFECSVFDGIYVTKDVDQSYLEYLASLRNDDAKALCGQSEVENLEMHNEG